MLTFYRVGIFFIYAAKNDITPYHVNLLILSKLKIQ